MKLKKTIIGLLTAFLFTNHGFAQIDTNDADIVQALFDKSKRSIITEHIQLNEKEKNLFWPIYDEYEAKRKSLEKERFLLLKEYANNYAKIDAAEASKLINIFLNSNDKFNKLYRTYFKKIEKVTGSLKAALFVQLESFIQTALQSNLQSQIPVIGELERLDKPESDQ